MSKLTDFYAHKATMVEKGEPICRLLASICQNWESW